MATSEPNQQQPKGKAYKALSNVDHDGKRYPEGKIIRAGVLDDDAAEALIAAKAIEPVGKGADVE